LLLLKLGRDNQPVGCDAGVNVVAEKQPVLTNKLMVNN